MNRETINRETISDDELRERLEKTTAPDIQMPHARARLRRELLEDGARLATRAHRRSPWRLGLAAAAAAALVLLAIQLLPQEITAAEVIRGMEAVYDADTIAGKVHYLRQILRTPGEPEIEEEQWALQSGARLRLLLRDAQTGDVIGHTITDGERVWASRDGRVRVHRVAKAGPAAAPTDPEQAPRMKMPIKMRVMFTTSPTGETTVDGERMMQSFLLTDLFDTEHFKRRTPRDVLDALLGEPDVTYTGVETDPVTGLELHVLERRTQSGSFPLKLEFPESYVARLQELSVSRPITEMIQQNELGGEVTVTPLEAFETIKVSADSSRISSVTLSALEDGREVYRAEKVFLGEAYMEPSPSLFDPTVYDLEPVETPNPVQEETP